MTKRMFEHREETHKSRMPLDRPSDFPAAALRAHLSNSLVPSQFSPIPDSPEVVNYQVMCPNTGSVPPSDTSFSSATEKSGM